MSAPVNEAPVESASESQEAPQTQTTETPAAETTVEPAVNESVEPTVTPEVAETAPEEEFSSTELDYWKKFSRSNENAKNKALNERNTLQSELETVKSELAAIKHESTVNSVLSEYGLSTAAKALLTAGDVDGLKAQAAALAELTGGKVPTAVTPVVTEQPKFINPLQGTSTQTPVNPPSFGEMFRDIQQ